MMSTQNVRTQMCCYLSPALLAEWPGSFTSYCGNVGATDTKISLKHQKQTIIFATETLTVLSVTPAPWSWKVWSHQQSVVQLMLVYRQKLKRSMPAIRSVETWSKDAIETLNGCSECTNSSMFFAVSTWCCSGCDLQLHPLLLQYMSWNQGSETLPQFQAMSDQRT